MVAPRGFRRIESVCACVRERRIVVGDGKKGGDDKNTLLELLDRVILETVRPIQPPDGLLRLLDMAPVEFEYRVVSVDTICDSRIFNGRAYTSSSPAI